MTNANTTSRIGNVLCRFDGNGNLVEVFNTALTGPALTIEIREYVPVDESNLIDPFALRAAELGITL